jgi:CHAT domain-containing protein
MPRFFYSLILFFVFILFVFSISCSQRPKDFNVFIQQNGEPITFGQSLYNGLPFGKSTMRKIEGGSSKISHGFSFKLADPSSVIYGILSIETSNVGQACSSIVINRKFLTCLSESLFQKSWTIVFVPGHLFQLGKNTVRINASPSDPFNIYTLELSITRESRGKTRVFSNPKRTEGHFPAALGFLSKLTDEELYTAIIQMPILAEEFGFRYGFNRRKLGYVYSRIGDFARWNGDYLNNLNYQIKAVQAEASDGISPLGAYLRARLGLAYYYMGNYDIAAFEVLHAEKDLKRARQNAVSIYYGHYNQPGHHIDFHIKSYLATIFYHLGRREEAKKYAHQVTRKKPDPNTRLIGPVARSLAHRVLGDVARDEGDLFNAGNHYQTGISTLSGIKHLRWNIQVAKDEILNLQLSLANIFFLKGETSKALKLLNEMETPTHECLWRAHLLRGKIYESDGKTTRAAENYLEAIREIEHARASLLSHGFKITFMNDKQEPYERMIRILVKMEKVKDAFHFAEKAKARAFLDLLANSDVSRRLLNENIKALTDEEKELRGRIKLLQNKLDHEKVLREDRGTNPETIRDITIARRELELFYKQKGASHLDFASIKTVDVIPIEDLQAQLGEDATLIEYFYDNNALYVWLIDGKKVRFVMKEIPADTLEKWVRDFRQILTTPLSEKQATDVRGKHSSDKLHELTKYKLERALLEDVLFFVESEKVYIVPHRALHYLPFHALPFEDSDYLIERLQIGYLPSASSMKYVIFNRKAGFKKILAMGNPTVGSSEMDLPFAEDEVLGIKYYFPATEVLVGPRASEYNLKRLAEVNDIIHIASHGEFYPETPMLSCLRLSPGDGEDGKLEIREIFQLELNAYLVTLSACDTAIGKLERGDELIGMSRAFFFAGTPSLLGSIWRVRDKSTNLLMQKFYQNLHNMDKMAALQKAQLFLIRDPTYAHPTHWAGFQIIGDYF